MKHWLKTSSDDGPDLAYNEKVNLKVHFVLSILP